MFSEGHRLKSLQGGHTLSAIYTKGAMPLYKVTCMPRGHALGVVSRLYYVYSLRGPHCFLKDAYGT
jgi:ATP-dependent Zn protease